MQVTDANRDTDSLAFAITISPSSLAITTSLLPDGTVGTAYTQALAATGGAPPYSWVVAPASGLLPPGLALSETGEIAGIPSREGTFNFTVAVKDAGGNGATQSFTITIATGQTPLTITTSSPLPDGFVGTPYSQTLRVSGGTLPYLWEVDALPPGLRLNPETGSISGTPTTAGTFGFTALVTDAAGAGVKKDFTITILADALEIISSALAEGVVGASYSDTLKARGGAPPYSWTVTEGSLPPRLALDSSTGVISGVPTTAGVFRLIVQVADSQRATASKTFTITVTSPLLITNDSTLPGGTVGVSYSEALIATGGTGTYEWLQLTAMPPGLRFDEAIGVIFGAPTETGLFKFAIQVTSGSERVGGTFFIEFASSGSRTAALAITSEALLPIGILRTAYQQTLVAAGGRLPYRWSVIEGPLPEGLVLDAATGELAGIPATEGEFKFAVRVTDADLTSATKTFFLQIASPSLSITTGAALPSGVLRVPYFLQLTASGGSGNYVWQFVDGALPPGLQLDASGVISGTPTSAGTFSFLVKMGDSSLRLEPVQGRFELVVDGSACVASLSHTSQVFSATENIGRAGVITADGCAWEAASEAFFLSISSGQTGTGSGTVVYTVAANNSTSGRRGKLIIAGQTFTVEQSGTEPLFLLRPSSVNFSFREGGARPESQRIDIYTNIEGLKFTAEAFTADGARWLSINPVNGTAPASLTVKVNPEGLPPGSYEGKVAVTIPNASPSSRTVPVTLTVEAVELAQLAVRPRGISASFALGGEARRKQITVFNLGDGLLDFQITASTASRIPWLSVEPASGTATLARPASVAAVLDPSGLAAGTYSGSVTVSSPATNQAIEIRVKIAVSAIPQAIRLSQRGLTFTAVAGGGPPPTQSFSVQNTGQGVMDWSVSAGAPGWLLVSPASGTTEAGTSVVPQVDVSINPAGLAPGQYYGRVSVSSPTAVNSPQIVSIVLRVLPGGSDPGPVVRPTGLVFIGTAGGDAPALQAVLISNVSSNSKAFLSGGVTADTSNWFTRFPASGTVGPSQTAQITVQPGTGGLSAGVRRGVLTIAFSDGTVRTVDLILVLVPGASTPQRVLPSARNGSCNPTELIPVFTLLGNQFNVSAAWPIPIETLVVDDCGQLLTAGAVVVTFSNGDPPLALDSLEDGRWSGTWQARNVGAAQVNITVTATIPGTTVQGTAQIVGGLQANPNIPQVGAGAVVSAASFAQQVPASPGSLISIFGVEMAEGTGGAEALPLNTQLAGTTVVLGGQSLPLLFASEGQINAMIPYDIAINTEHQLVVQRGTSFTVPEPVTVAPAQPAVFTLNQSGQGQGLVFVATATTQVLADGSNPAKAGDVVIVWCSGLGLLDQTVVAGEAAPFSPLARTVDPVTVTIGGVNASVQFAGLAPGFTGLYQVNALVPAGVTPGDDVPVVLNVAGQTSPTVTMAVQ